MFYVTLGNKSIYDTSGNFQPGYGPTNTGPFSYVSNDYWSATEFVAPSTNLAWDFCTHFGSQGYDPKSTTLYAWAVHSGDVGVAVSNVPVPAAAWLFGSGLFGLIGMPHRKSA